MNEKNIQKILLDGENEKTEFKKSTAQMENALKSVCGFLNYKGGSVYFGISDKNKILGQDVSDSTIKSISQKIRQKIKPEISFEIKVLDVDGRKVIGVKIKEGSNKPYYLDGIAYKRVGTESPLISTEELERIILNKHEQRFDSKICRGAIYEDIDLDALNRFKKKYRTISGKDLQGRNAEILKSLNCIIIIADKINPTNAGILLFGKNPVQFFPKSYITIARYPGIDIGNAYLDLKDIEGNIFNVIDSTEKYINEHIESLYRLKEGQMARERIPQYPQFVIRELIANAVAHRDYRIRGSKTLIKMYKDRIEFDSPGGFGGNVNEKNILTEQYSRNPIIAKCLNKTRYIEEMGEGWNRIFKEVKNYFLKFTRLPEIKGDSRVVITLFSPLLEETTTSAFLGVQLNERQKKAIEFLNINGRITTKEYMKLTKAPLRTAKRDLIDLKNKKKIQFIGSLKTGYYCFDGTINGTINGTIKK
ncbi:MAG: putative DNA binding domain-containing protein [Candidatus Aenigmarchaeota archaeon]|nr:putative DNA binding domain-containing protein [Candidatus Aenigmarchaeota archaeon]